MLLRLLVVALGFVSCLSTAESHAQDARVWIYADSVAVGDQFHVTLSVDRAIDTQALFPSPQRGDTMLGDLEIVAVESGRPVQTPDNAIVRDSVRYLVTTFALDSAVVPPLEIILIQNGDTVTAITRAASIPVRSLVPDDAEDVRDIAPIVPFQRAWWPWLVAGLVAAIMALAAVLLYRRRKRRVQTGMIALPEPDVPPYEEAMQRLAKLEEIDLDRAEEVKSFYVDLADVLRRYLERRTGIPALESTTSDLMRLLEKRQMQGFPSTAVALVRKVLELADLAKFADARPPASKGYQSVGEARQVIDEVETILRPEPELVARDA